MLSHWQHSFIYYNLHEARLSSGHGGNNRIMKLEDISIFHTRRNFAVSEFCGSCQQFALNFVVLVGSLLCLNFVELVSSLLCLNFVVLVGSLL